MTPSTPTLDRIKEAHEQSEAIGAFLEWGQEHGLFMCRYDHDRKYFYFAESTDALLHLYFRIDAKKEEQERRAVLDYIQSQKTLSLIHLRDYPTTYRRRDSHR